MDNVTDITRKLGEARKAIQASPEIEALYLIEQALRLRLEYLLSSAKQQAA